MLKAVNVGTSIPIMLLLLQIYKSPEFDIL